MQTMPLSNETMPKPQAPKRKKGFVYWISRIPLALAVIVIALGVMGAIFQAIATYIDKRNYPAPGQMIDLDGYRLHLYCSGEGNPTVILEAGQPLGVSSWAWVQPELAKTMRVCVYDRAGLGWSDPAPANTPRDGEQMARELHTLLQNAGTPGPYVLVGHSFGGLVTRIFAGAYPGEIVGLVWVEALHPDNFPRKGLPESTLQGLPPESTTFIPPMARLGVMRLVAFLTPDPNLPAQQQAEYRAMFAAAKFWDSIVATEQNFPAINAQARGVDSLGNIPLMIVIGGESESMGVGFEMQNELMILSTNSVQRVVNGATHTSLLHDQQHAQQTLAAILEIVEAVRNGQPLVPGQP